MFKKARCYWKITSLKNHHAFRFPNIRLFSSGFNPGTVTSNPETNFDKWYPTPFVIFDTAKSKMCQLSTKRPNVLTWYSCGPTVYDSAHIGHASSFIRQDVIRRILQAEGKDLTVIQVMGITDIDDKIINKANQSGRDWKAVRKQYEQEFIEDLQNLNVIQPHIFTRVSDYIPQILRFVGKLVETGYAYPSSNGSVYFDTDKYGNRYGKFRQQSLEEHDPEFLAEKKNFKDFALWKGAKPGEPHWESPWGTKRGRPGWHIECSVMASQIFGPTLDLHTGGQDLIFPHHENEEAQCCAHFDSKQWTAHWLHMGHLHFKGDAKMSKSLGNTLSIRDFREQYSSDLLRVMCILSNYRNNLEYSPDSIDIGQKILKKFRTFLSDTNAILNGSKPVTTAADDATFWGKLESAKHHLRAALRDDFDTPEALKIVTEVMTAFNSHHVPLHTDTSMPKYVNFELVLESKIFVEDFLNLVGLVGFSSDSKTLPKSGSNIGTNAHYENLANQYVQFRHEVRSFALAMDESNKDLRKQKMGERRELIRACDEARKQLLAEANIEIKDHGKTSSWSFLEPDNKAK